MTAFKNSVKYTVGFFLILQGYRCCYHLCHTHTFFQIVHVDLKEMIFFSVSADFYKTSIQFSKLRRIYMKMLKNPSTLKQSQAAALNNSNYHHQFITSMIIVHDYQQSTTPYRACSLHFNIPFFFVVQNKQ